MTTPQLYFNCMWFKTFTFWLWCIHLIRTYRWKVGERLQSGQRLPLICAYMDGMTIPTWNVVFPSNRLVHATVKHNMDMDERSNPANQVVWDATQEFRAVVQCRPQRLRPVQAVERRNNQGSRSNRQEPTSWKACSLVCPLTLCGHRSVTKVEKPQRTIRHLDVTWLDFCDVLRQSHRPSKVSGQDEWIWSIRNSPGGIFGDMGNWPGLQVEQLAAEG